MKVVSTVLIIAFCLSGFVFFDAYKRQVSNLKSVYEVYKGDKALKEAKLQEAIYWYEKAIQINPKHYRALYNLANIYVVYEDYYSAIKNYEKALEVKPDFELARINLAIILSQVYRTDDAIEEYKKVLEFQPKLIQIPFLFDRKKSYEYNKGIALYNMGLAYRTKSLLADTTKEESRQFLEKASEAYEKAVKILKSYNSNYNLALINQLLKNNSKAIIYYCKAMEIEPMQYEAHFNYAILLNEMKDYTGAQEEFKKAGLLLDTEGDSTKTGYIYSLLDEVNKKASLSNEKSRDIPEETFKYKAGKLVIDTSKKSEQTEEMMNFFSTCANRQRYIGDKK
ncbi:tetratricopeptide repeat protein [bacterium]|nr:tetratricopeptide repeat protein [bacterium]